MTCCAIHGQILDNIVQHNRDKDEVFQCQSSTNRWADTKDKCYIGGIFETLRDNDATKLVGVAG